MNYHKLRAEALSSIQTHPWLHKIWNRLTERECQLVRDFLSSHLDADWGAFEMSVNRLYMDRPDARVGHWKEILELLSNLNSKARLDSLGCPPARPSGE
jgi:hypothetical protein